MKKKILFLANHDVILYNQRIELISQLINKRYEVFVSFPKGELFKTFENMGCKFIETPINRHGKNPLEDLRLISHYRRIISEIKPDIIFSYTIKPNLYGAIAANMYKIPVVANITGLGTAVENPSLTQKLIILLYKYAFKNVKTVFVQNTENRDFFIKNKIAVDKLKLLPGSGVNLERFAVIDYPDGSTVEFVFIARVMKEKGIEQYLEAAKYIKQKYQNTKFHVCGFCEDNYKSKLPEYEEKGIIIYHGLVNDIRDILAYTHCTVLPTYYPEGINNSLLESCACGRPIITTDRSGCREVVDDGINGYMIPAKDSAALIAAIERFLELDNYKRKQMGIAGRKKVENEFDRNIVIDKYFKEING